LRRALEVGRCSEIETACENAKQRPPLGITGCERWGMFQRLKVFNLQGYFLPEDVQGRLPHAYAPTLRHSIAHHCRDGQFCFRTTSQPAAVPPTSDVSQFVRAGVTRVLVRYEWQWDRGAAGGGTWLAEQGVVTGVGPNWIVLRTDNTNRTLLIPFSAFKHLEFLN
jgi:hypothetical protein